MDKNKIVVIRLYSGEQIIGSRKCEGEGLTEYTLENPRTISLIPSMGGSVGIGFRPVCLFGESCKKELTIDPSQVMVCVPESELPKELIDGYMSEVSGIEIASASSVPDLTGKPKAGSFSL